MKVITEDKENVVIDFSKKEFYIIQNWLLDLNSKNIVEPINTTLNNFISLNVEQGIFDDISKILKNNNKSL